MAPVVVNRFNTLKDNRVRPIEAQWGDFCTLIAEGHTVAPDRTDVPLFNAFRYRSFAEVKKDAEAIVCDKVEREYFVRRKNINIVEATMLVLDYDGGLSLEAAKERFRCVQYIGYTSFHHLHDGKTEKFRLILRLAESIPAWCKVDDYERFVDGGEWYELSDALKEFAGPCDPASFRPNQIYYLPAAHPDRLASAHVWVNDGEPLNWRGFARHPARRSKALTPAAVESVSAPRRSERTLDPNWILNTENGPVRVGDVQGKLEGVQCPFHQDKHGSEFVRRVPETGSVFLHCKRCEQTFYMNRSVEETNEPSKKIATLDELFDKPNVPRIGKFTDAADRTRVNKQLRRIADRIHRHSKRMNKDAVRRPDHPSHIVYLPEGAGKSRLAVDLAQRGEKVIFACKSWNQAFEKFESFREAGKPHGLQVRMFLSKDGKARRRFGVPVVRKPGDRPFRVGAIDDEASIQAFIAANPKLSPDFIRLSWRFFRSDYMGPSITGIHNVEPDEEAEDANTQADAFEDEFSADESVNVAENANIIVTTFAQLRILKLKRQRVPLDWLIWFDDPDFSDVIDIEAHDPKRHGPINDGNPLKELNEIIDENPNKSLQDVLDESPTRGMRQINGRWYFYRDKRQSLGRAFKRNKCVYTTTEVITKQALQRLLKKRQEYFLVHNKMEGISGGKITVLGTDKVYKAYDGIVPLLARRLNKEGFAVRLIADGLSQELNHSNSKGKNTLADDDILVELSLPHPSEVRTVCDALGQSWQSENRRVRREMMLDRMHQAIGRNSGYRDRGKECVILADKKSHAWLKRETRYLIDMDNSVVIDRTADMSRKDRRTQKGASQLVQAVETFLNNIDTYLQDGRKVFSDVDFVLESVTDVTKRVLYTARLLAALTNLSGVRFDKSNAEPLTPTANGFLRVGQRVLEKWVEPAGLTATVLQQYRMIVDTQESSG